MGKLIKWTVIIAAVAVSSYAIYQYIKRRGQVAAEATA